MGVEWVENGKEGCVFFLLGPVLPSAREVAGRSVATHISTGEHLRYYVSDSYIPRLLLLKAPNRDSIRTHYYFRG